MKRRSGWSYMGIVLALLALLSIGILPAAGCGCNSDSGSNGSKPSSGNYGELLENSDFFSGLQGWSVINEGGSRVHGTNNVDVVKFGETLYAVHMSRSCPENDGGAAGVYQKLDELVYSGSKLTVKAMVRAELERGGALAGSNPEFAPEGPVIFRILYNDAEGNPKEWYHGFYYSDVDGADEEHFTKVRQGVWFEYLSGDLAPVFGEGSTVTEFRAYGFGWDFEGYATDISFTISR